MILSCNLEELSSLSVAEIIHAILERRAEIRSHRDQVGDNRCFLDDYLIWKWLSDSPAMPDFKAENGIRQCVLFYEHRRAETKDPILDATVVDPTKWDDDLHNISHDDAVEQLLRLQTGIKKHRGLTLRTLEDDRELYNLLPEKVPADLRLPPREEFLGEAKSPHAGCPAFWRSHRNCNPKLHNLHVWGPC